MKIKHFQDLNEPHQQSSHKTWRTSVKTQETNLESKKKIGAANFIKEKLGRRWRWWGDEWMGMREGKCKNLVSFFSSRRFI